MMTDDEVDAAIRAAFSMTSDFVPASFSRAAYRAGYAAGQAAAVPL